MARKPTMQDVAELAGVSRSLVSLVFADADNVSAARRAAVLEAAEQLGYRPNRVARNLARGRSASIGIVLDDLQNPFFARTVEGIEAEAAVHGYHLLLANGGRDPGRFIEATRTFIDLGVDAVIAVGPRGDLDVLDTFARTTPVTVVSRHLASEMVDSISNDERQGSALVVEHLAELGHRNIVHVDGGAGAGAQERRNGYLEAMGCAGLSATARVIPGEFTVEAGQKVAAELLAADELPTAVFTANDLMATGLWVELSRASVSIPGDVSLVGYDDSSRLGLGRFGLTTVHQPSRQIGHRAAGLVLERLSADFDERAAVHELIPPHLVIRFSTSEVVP